MDIIESRCTLHGSLVQYAAHGESWPEAGSETCPIQSHLTQEPCGLPLMHVLAQDNRPVRRAENPLSDLNIGNS